MPEITEVVLTSQYVFSKIKNCLITDIVVLGGRYSRGSGIPGLSQIPFPLEIRNINTKGKFFWIETYSKAQDKNYYILNTFGLSGGWDFEKYDHSNVEFKIKNIDGKTHLNLYFTDPRNFGTLKITSDKKDLDDKLDDLGQDFLKVPFTDNEFCNRVSNLIKKSKRNADTKIIKVLMNQTTSGLGSGLGNYLAPEILYRAKISPHRKLGELTNSELKTLSKTIKYVVKLSYLSNKTGYMENFGDWIDEHYNMVQNNVYPDYQPDVVIKKTDRFEFMVYQQKKDPLGNEVKRDIILGNRATYWVPSVQI